VRRSRSIFRDGNSPSIILCRGFSVVLRASTRRPPGFYGDRHRILLQLRRQQPTQSLTLANLYYGSESFSTQPQVSLGYFAQTQQPSPGSTGVAITHSAITYFSNDTASQTFTISVARDVPWATYAIGDVGCPVGGGYLLTVGYIPYWQSVFWISQLAEVIGILVITCLLTLAAVVSINLIQRARSGK